MPDPLPLVVSIQSQVAFGHVGNSAAALPMRACGVEVVEVPTTLLSNHPHYPTMRGRVLEPELVADLLAGLVERGVHARAAVILSGFLGRAGTAAPWRTSSDAARAANPGVVYACDPVMGDADIGFFAGEALRAAFAADLGAARRSHPAERLRARRARRSAGATRPRTSRPRARALGRRRWSRRRCPCPGGRTGSRPSPRRATGRDRRGSRLSVRPAGTGDLLSGLVAARLALGVPLPAAVARAVAGVGAALALTSDRPWAEMPVAAALSAIVEA